MIIVFRCDASLEIGTGHVRRCLILAQQLQKQGNSCFFSTNEDAPKLVKELLEFRTIAPTDLLSQKADLIITDHYNLPSSYYEQVQSLKILHMIIDDICEEDSYKCDFLLISNLAYNSSDYEGKISSHCHVYDGPQALLIDPRFLENKRQLNKKPQQPSKFFLFFGGTDPHKLTLRLLNIIDSHNIKIPHITCVIGAGNQQHVEIENLSNKLNVDLHVETREMLRLMSECHVSVGAGGTVMWEKMALQLPCIEFSHSECQRETLLRLSQNNYIKYVGSCYDLCDDQIASFLSNKLANGLDIRYCDFSENNITSLAQDLASKIRNN